jgi:hypothetical protein
MATIHMKRVRLKTHTYLSIDKVVGEIPPLLAIEIQEYNIVAGDISTDPNKRLAEYRRGWRKQGHSFLGHT